MAISRLVTKDGFNHKLYQHDKRNEGKYEYEYTHVGCVLSLGENNHYDDSNFYAHVWNEETQTVDKIYYDTTRCYTGTTAQVDATDDVRKKAKAWELKIARKNKAISLSKSNSIDRSIAMKHNISIRSLRNFKNSIANSYYDLCVDLLSKNIRSSFKKSLRERLITWLNDTERSFESPFSKRQWDALFTSAVPYKVYY